MLKITSSKKFKKKILKLVAVNKLDFILVQSNSIPSKNDFFGRSELSLITFCSELHAEIAIQKHIKFYEFYQKKSRKKIVKKI